MNDPIHNPAHYTAYPVQPIEITRYLGFCLGNAVKYVLRAPFKGGVEDCQKALKYLDWEKETPGASLLPPEAGEALQNLVAYLDGQPGAAVNQTEFLEHLRSYLTTGHGQYMQEMRFDVNELRMFLAEEAFEKQK